MRKAWRTICILSLLGSAYARGDVVSHGGCVVDSEIWALPQCALEMKGGRLYVANRYLRLYFPRKEPLAWALLPDGERSRGGGWAYFDRKGRIVVQNVATMDNGPNDFHHGLVRVVHKGKWGLANLHGAIVVPLKYDGMLDFDEHSKRWVVCSDCHDVTSGEYHWFEAGEWFWLDQHGRFGGRCPPPKV